MASNTLHAKTHETILRTTELNINSGLTSTAHLSEQATQNTNRLVELLEGFEKNLKDSTDANVAVYTQVITMLRDVVERNLLNYAGIPEAFVRLKVELQAAFDAGSNVSLGKVEEILGTLDQLKNSIGQNVAGAREGLQGVDEIQLPPVPSVREIVQPSATLVGNVSSNSAPLHPRPQVPFNFREYGAGAGVRESPHQIPLPGASASAAGFNPSSHLLGRPQGII